jgi:hypothetical protein
MSQTIINGRAYDFSAVIIRAKGVAIEDGVSEISYKHSVERGSFFGNSRKRKARSSGKYSAEGSTKMLRITHVALVTALGGDGYLDEEFEITVSYADHGQPVITDYLKNVHAQRGRRQRVGGQRRRSRCRVTWTSMKLWMNGVKPVKEKAQ